MSALDRHVALANAFETDHVLDVVESADAVELRKQQLDHPYRKDYDLAEDPIGWLSRFDVSNWTLIAAFDADARIGGAVGAMDTPGLELLEGRRDLAALWDIRVSPAVRRQGVGSILFRSIEAWAHAHACRELVVETQNTNVVACAFYANQGCHLKRATRGAYPDFPDEVQLIWGKAVAPNNGLHRATVSRIGG